MTRKSDIAIRPELWSRIRELFHAAADLPAEKRAAFLDRACAGEAEVRAQVDSLLRASDDLIGQTRGIPGQDDRSSLAAAALDTPPTIGPYRLLDLLGEGGFGSVYLAEQSEPVARQVALKILRPGLSGDDILTRFHSEKQALAKMEHPNIARIFDAGATDAGRPYFVMELVRGPAITDFCDQQTLGIVQRLRIFISVCHAVQHAHQKGIIHRDIKPSNVLIVTHEGDPLAKVIDFGISKAIADPLIAGAALTQEHQMIGTPAYMSPEQAGLGDLDIDTRSDIYSLGALLYELLTGTTPIQRERIRSASYSQIQRLIREEEAQRPSMRAAAPGEPARSAAECRQCTPRQLSRLLADDLDWICLRTLEKDRSRRYDTARDLAADMERYLKREAVLAGPPTAIYRLKKFAQRNRFAVTASAVIAASIIAGSAISTWQWRRAARERDHAMRRFNDVRELSNAMMFDVYDAIDHLAGATAAKKLLAAKARTYLDKLWQEAGDDPALGRELAVAYIKVGDILGAPGSANVGDLPSAIEAYDRALLLLRRLVALDTQFAPVLERDLAYCLRSLSDAKSQSGDHKSATLALDEALSLATGQAARHPADTAAQEELGLCLALLGNLKAKEGNADEALGAYDEAIRAFVQQAGSNTDDPQLLRRLAGVNLRIAQVRERSLGPTSKLADAKPAREMYEKAIVILRGLTKRDPTHATDQRSLALNLGKVGELNLRLKNYEGAAAPLEEALGISRRLASLDPADANAQRDLSIGLSRIANLRSELGDHVGAIEAYREILKIDTELAAADPTNAEAQRDLIVTHFHIGRIWVNRRIKVSNLDQALACVDEAQSHFMAAAKIAESLKSAGRLAGEDDKWPEDLDVLNKFCDQERQRLNHAKHAK